MSNEKTLREHPYKIAIPGALIQKFLGWYGEQTGIGFAIPDSLSFEGSFFISASETGFFIRADIRDVKPHPDAPMRGDHVDKIQVEIVNPVELKGL
ncbi:MAG: hypothetical protein HXS54_05880 [Theionarchaea archaeon]|nr:hypothetical protein [Theionarchaea archaeon]